eukprot:TRINITY_DN501_c1_g2_i1.p2 TRINITY_DN501_c1_g2~~TRINITY_DN501_c1_g2_i1.p2  ORF type:complete len:121 (+),score=56.24 TRINITY_DN501_c1_g2_i1:216-578(+)
MFRTAMRVSAMRAPVMQIRSHVNLSEVQKAIGAEGDLDRVVRDGYVQINHLDDLLRKQGCNLTAEQLQEVVDAMDENHDGKVSISEFRNFLYPVDFEGDGCLEDHDAYIPESEKRMLASL